MNRIFGRNKNWCWTIILLLNLIACNSINVYDRVQRNYGIEIDKLSKDFNLSPAYLKALIVLESSGYKNIQPRLEKHIYKKLQLVKQGKIKSYEGLTYKHLKNTKNESIRNLASSWGPFQIMGYKCVHLGINVAALRGDSSVYWGTYWINKEYGDYLRKRKFEAAFRIHNTGSPTGKTFHSNYVQRGLLHIEHFSS